LRFYNIHDVFSALLAKEHQHVLAVAMVNRLAVVKNAVRLELLVRLESHRQRLACNNTILRARWWGSVVDRPPWLVLVCKNLLLDPCNSTLLLLVCTDLLLNPVNRTLLLLRVAIRLHGRTRLVLVCKILPVHLSNSIILQLWVDKRLIGKQRLVLLVCRNILLVPLNGIIFLLNVSVSLLDRRRHVHNKVLVWVIQSHNFYWSPVSSMSYSYDTELHWSELLEKLTVDGHQSQVCRVVEACDHQQCESEVGRKVPKNSVTNPENKESDKVQHICPNLVRCILLQVFRGWHSGVV
jgi:hypothetical protein